MGLVTSLHMRQADLYPTSVHSRSPSGSLTDNLAEQMSQDDLAVLLKLALEFEAWRVEVYEKISVRSLENLNTIYRGKVDQIAKSPEGKMIDATISAIRWTMLRAESDDAEDDAEDETPVELDDVTNAAAPAEVVQ